MSMKNIKMVVTDLDNTLLRTDKTISDYTAGVLNKCRQNGIKVAFATARQERNTVDFAKIAKPDLIISCNGAKVSGNGQIILLKYISPFAAKSIVDTLRSEDFIFVIDYKDYSLTNDKDYLNWAGESWGLMFTDFTEYELRGIQRISVKEYGGKSGGTDRF